MMSFHSRSRLRERWGTVEQHTWAAGVAPWKFLCMDECSSVALGCSSVEIIRFPKSNLV